MKQLKLTAILFTVVLSVLSAYLTFEMTKELGSSLGYPLVLGVIGLCLEGAKQVFSVTMVMCFKANNRVVGVLFIILTGALVLISLCATMFTLNKGVSDTQTQSAQHIAITQQIVRLENLYQTQIKHKRFTKSENTINQIQKLENVRASIQPDDVLSKHGDEISLFISVLIEATNIALIIVIFLCKQPKILQVKPEPDENVEVNKQSTSKKDKELSLSIKADISCGNIKPSVRGITSKYSGVGRELIKIIFNDLKAENIIEEHGKGWKLTHS